MDLLTTVENRVFQQHKFAQVIQRDAWAEKHYSDAITFICNWREVAAEVGEDVEALKDFISAYRDAALCKYLEGIAATVESEEWPEELEEIP